MLTRVAARIIDRLPEEVVDAGRRRILDTTGREWLVHPAVARQPQPSVLAMDPTSYHEPRILRFDGDAATVTVGRFCSISDTAEIFLGVGHDHRRPSTAPLRWRLGMEPAPAPDYESSRGSITIGNDVFVGWQATIMSGITIGDGAFVTAKAVVTRDVAPYAIVSGNPATLLRYRFDEATRAALLRIRWWEWPDDMVRANVDVLLSHDVAGFVATHDPALRG